MTDKQVTYSQEQLNIACKSYSDDARSFMDVKASLMLQNFNLKKSNQELIKQNADLRKELTELKAKIDIPVDGKEYNGKPNSIQNIP